MCPPSCADSRRVWQPAWVVSMLLWVCCIGRDVWVGGFVGAAVPCFFVVLWLITLPRTPPLPWPVPLTLLRTLGSQFSHASRSDLGDVHIVCGERGPRRRWGVGRRLSRHWGHFNETPLPRRWCLVVCSTRGPCSVAPPHPPPWSWCMMRLLWPWGLFCRLPCPFPAVRPGHPS